MYNNIYILKMKLLSIIFFIYWILYTFVSSDIIMNTILNKNINLKNFKKKEYYKNLIKLTNINFIISAYYFSNINNETYFLALIFSLIVSLAYFIFFYLNNKNIISLIDHTIPFFILLIFGKSNLKINFTYKTFILLTFIILYSKQYKDIYGFK